MDSTQIAQIPLYIGSDGSDSDKITHKSTVTGIGPVRLVWEIADANPGMRRSDVIRMAEAAGVATYTARTQYQRWFTHQKEQRAGTQVP